MLAIILSWICIGFIFLSFGDFFALIYRKTTKQNEEYSMIDKFFLGMTLTVILVSISSLWLPSNQNILAVYIFLSVVYWVIQKKHLAEEIQNITDRFRTFSKREVILISLITISFLLLPIWVTNMDYDSLFYHNAALRWNEEFAVVPGLGNLEERLAFNSNYLLLTALFSFRFIFDDPIIGLQSLMAYLIMIWILSEIIKNNYEPKRIVLFVLYIIFILFYVHKMNETSTDIIPNLVIMYLGSKAVLYPDIINRNKLLYALLPICMVTFKLSGFLTAIFTFYILFTLYKQKEFKPIVFITTISGIIVSVWLVRNIVISGYLVHPVYMIDLFSFDWKIPLEAVIKEKLYIEDHAWGNHQDAVWRGFKRFAVKRHFSWHLIIYVIGVASIIVSGIKVIKTRKTMNHITLIVYITLLANILYISVTAPTLRFMYGYVTVFVLFTITLFLHNRKEKTVPSAIDKSNNSLYKILKTNPAFVLLLTCLFTFNSYKHAYKYKRFIKNNQEEIAINPWLGILYKPFSMSHTFIRIRSEEKIAHNYEVRFEPYTLNNNITIYVSTDKRGFVFDKIPAVCDYRIAQHSIFQDYRNLEARGSSLQDGFRSKVLKQE